MRVNVDDIAFMDRRFKLLGGRLGMAWQEALGRCLPVWALAYAKRTPILPAGDVDALAERAGFAAAMVAVELASDEPSDTVYLCGVNDRIDFLLMQDAKREKAREARLAAAGVKKSPGPSRGKRNESPGPSRGDVPGTGSYSPDLAPDLDLAPDPEDQKLTLPRDPAAPVQPGTAPHTPQHPDAEGASTWDFVTGSQVAPVPCTHAAQELADRRRALFWRSWQLAGEAFSRVRASGIDPSAPNGWAGLPDSGSPPAKNLRAIIDGMLVGERPDFATAEAKIANRIAVAEAEARALSPPTARYLTPARIWNRDSFAIAVDLSPEQAAQPRPLSPRAGPTSSAERAHKKPTPLDNLFADIARREAAGET